MRPNSVPEHFSAQGWGIIAVVVENGHIESSIWNFSTVLAVEIKYLLYLYFMLLCCVQKAFTVTILEFIVLQEDSVNSPSKYFYIRLYIHDTSMYMYF